jgi:phosphate transport system permease protein
MPPPRIADMNETAGSAAARPAQVRRPPRATRRSVLIVDRLANWTITVGGLLVIVAVATIMLFLVQVVVPLFTGARIDSTRSYTVPDLPRAVVMANADEYRTIGLALGRDGKVAAWHLQTGTPLAPRAFELGAVPATYFTRTIDRSNIAFGFADGTVRFGSITLPPTVLLAEAITPALRQLDERDHTDGTSVFSRIPGNQVRRIDIALNLDAPQQVAPAGTPIIAMDYRRGGTAERPTLSFVTADANGTVRLSRAEGRLNIMTRQMRTTVETSELPALARPSRVRSLLMTDKADAVLVGTADGEVFRFDTRDFRNPRLAEQRRLTEGDGGLSGLYFLIGEQSLVAVGDRGMVDVFFSLPGGRDTADGFHLVRAHVLERHAAGVEAVAASQRGKMFLTADADGAIWLRHSTSGQVMLRMQKPGGVERYAAITLSPRDDAVMAIATDGRVALWNIHAPHPETTLRTIFGRVWYEGYTQPTFTWQSSAATDSFEPKLSLVPLIFGTIKATVYALMFAVPIALLAAIYTSEFVHRRVRAVVKPAMEMMASLPSVVLGFIAALILAPIVEDIVPAVLLALILVPVCVFSAGFLWQMLPRPLTLRLSGIPRFALMFVALFAAVQLAAHLAPWFEDLVFAGDVKAWLSGHKDGAVGFTTFLFLPIGLLVTVLVVNRVAGPALDAAIGARPRAVTAVLAALRWGLTGLAGLAVTFAFAELIVGFGYDPRGGVVDTYVQRNTLVVGFAMGFAVIPIIYTIAEDALNSVPEHLRAASLSCGATQWQTATRVILPTAASGVFAAVMIGMGRAVGETMIVVMAAGNTPVMEWNIFSGLRALSANIAVELPEAVRDGTLYRMLFLAALTLFAMTFVVNTLAEVIRLRFRRRAAML